MTDEIEEDEGSFEVTLADDKEANPSQEGNCGAASQEGNKSRDYTRAVYQNLMAVVELLDKKAPLPVSQKQIQEELGLSKGVVYDICWNLCARKWTEDLGNGTVRAKSKFSKADEAIGKKVIAIINEIYGVDFGGKFRP